MEKEKEVLEKLGKIPEEFKEFQKQSLFVKKDTFEFDFDEYDELFDYDKFKQKYQLKDNLKDYY